jgi:hypothetical protein
VAGRPRYRRTYERSSHRERRRPSPQGRLTVSERRALPMAAPFRSVKLAPCSTSMATSPSAGVSVHWPRQRSLVAEPCARTLLGPIVVASRARPRSLATEPLRPTARRRGVEVRLLGVGDEPDAVKVFFMRIIGLPDGPEP